MSSDLTLPYKSPEEVEKEVTAEPSGLILTAWSIQNIVYELLKNYMVVNSPKTVGFNINAKYDEDPTKSDIELSIAYNWDAQKTGKRPAIFVQRGEETFDSPTIAQASSYTNIKNSEVQRLTINTVPILVKIIASPIGFVEQLAEYIKQPLLHYRHDIQRDFNLRRFRVEKMSAPQIYVEAKDNFVIIISITAVFDEGWIITGNDLKLKSVGRVIFDSVVAKPFDNQ